MEIITERFALATILPFERSLSDCSNPNDREPIDSGLMLSFGSQVQRKIAIIMANQRLIVFSDFIALNENPLGVNNC